jgi:hypothetical protein
MQHIPYWALAAVPAGAGVVVAEPVEREIPYGLETRDKERFAERYPDVIGDEVAALEVFDLEIVSSAHGRGVLAQPLP